MLFKFSQWQFTCLNATTTRRHFKLTFSSWYLKLVFHRGTTYQTRAPSPPPLLSSCHGVCLNFPRGKAASTRRICKRVCVLTSQESTILNTWAYQPEVSGQYTGSEVQGQLFSFLTIGRLRLFSSYYGNEHLQVQTFTRGISFCPPALI